ncbi:hypothetical protein EDD22DRAFT_846203 [Suillus occidentalis]|nr:hypothetical protein EDD22DRAFT_846203 [Suillus occidentalis]
MMRMVFGGMKLDCARSWSDVISLFCSPDRDQLEVAQVAVTMEGAVRTVFGGCCIRLRTNCGKDSKGEFGEKHVCIINDINGGQSFPGIEHQRGSPPASRSLLASANCPATKFDAATTKQEMQEMQELQVLEKLQDLQELHELQNIRELQELHEMYEFRELHEVHELYELEELEELEKLHEVHEQHEL